MQEDAFQRGEPLMSILERLDSGQIRSRDLVETALRRIEDPDGQGPVAYCQVYRERAAWAARQCDQLRAKGESLALTGIPLSVKDLFDLIGEVTLAGSVVLKDQEPAASFAPAVERLLSHQAILMGRTNMTEFAYSGLGLNPHYGTPLSPWRRHERRIAGGSTSGGAVSVAEGMAVAALGTDTGGSVRIPAAFCGLAGFKSTSRRIPREGVFPLSRTLDSIGVIAPTVQCCRYLDRVLSLAWPQEQDKPRGRWFEDAEERQITPGRGASMLKDLRVGVPQSYVLDDLDPEIEHAFGRALDQLGHAGVRVDEVPIEMLMEIPEHYEQGGLLAIEAYALHRRLLDQQREKYDPRVAVRMEGGRGRLASEYLDLLDKRRDFIRAFEACCREYDLLAWPTVALLPPRLDKLQDDDEAYFSTNVRVLRNTAVTNFLDRPSLSIPLKGRRDAPIGFMVSAPSMQDRRLLDLGCALEPILRK
ncbi:MAG TPA: amidase [Acidobacteriota bacterium]|nr:amidase [Acidobacteriota bacterium]